MSGVDRTTDPGPSSTGEPELTADVIVVGARVTGSALAARLGDLGLDVLLLDRAPLPAPAVSTHVIGRTALGFLEQLGVLDEVLAIGAPPLRHWHVEVAGMHYGGPMLIPPPHGHNLCVRRQPFDDVLLRRAAATRGVRVRTRTSVRGLIVEDGRVTGVRTASWTARAPVVVGADGASSTVARAVGAPPRFDVGAGRAAAHAYWRGVVPLPEPSLELWHDGADVLQLMPCDAGLWVLLLSTPLEAHAALRRGGERGYRERLLAIPAMASRLREAELASPVFVTASTNVVRTASGPGWFLAGDALGTRDPLFGSGIADGLRAVDALAPLLADLVEGSLADVEVRHRYDAAVGERILDPLREGLADLSLPGPREDQLAWIRAMFGHPALALELGERAADLVAGLPPERRAFWSAVAEHAATLDELPAPAQPGEDRATAHDPAAADDRVVTLPDADQLAAASR